MNGEPEYTVRPITDRRPMRWRVVDREGITWAELRDPDYAHRVTGLLNALNWEVDRCHERLLAMAQEGS